MQVGARDPRDMVKTALSAGKASTANNIQAGAAVANGGVQTVTGGDAKIASGPNVTPNVDPGVQNTQNNFNSMVNAGGIQRTQTGNIGAGRGGNGALLAFGKKDDATTKGLNDGRFDFGTASDEDVEGQGLTGVGNPLHRKIVHPDGREGMMAIG